MTLQDKLISGTHTTKHTTRNDLSFIRLSVTANLHASHRKGRMSTSACWTYRARWMGSFDINIPLPSGLSLRKQPSYASSCRALSPYWTPASFSCSRTEAYPSGRPIFCVVSTILCCVSTILCCVLTTLCLRFDNFVLCFDNFVLCFDNFVLCFDNFGLCFTNIDLCFKNIVLCFKNCLLCLQIWATVKKPLSRPFWERIIIYADFADLCKITKFTLRHQYWIFGGKSQASFSRNTTRARSEEGQLFLQAKIVDCHLGSLRWDERGRR